MSEPKFQDVVRNKVTNATGTIIAKYSMTILSGKNRTNTLVDVRLEDGENDRGIWYASPIENWEVIQENTDGGL